MRTHPASILPGAKSVVVIAVKYPDATIDQWGKPPAESMFFWHILPVTIDRNRIMFHPYVM